MNDIPREIEEYVKMKDNMLAFIVRCEAASDGALEMLDEFIDQHKDVGDYGYLFAALKLFSKDLREK